MRRKIKKTVRRIEVEFPGPDGKRAVQMEFGDDVKFYEAGTGNRLRLVLERSVAFPAGTKKLINDLASLSYPEEDSGRESREVELLKEFSLRARAILENREREER